VFISALKNNNQQFIDSILPKPNEIDTPSDELKDIELAE